MVVVDEGRVTRVEEDTPGTRDLVVVCGDATIATSTLLLAAAFPWVREVMEEVGEETALSLPSLTSSLLTTFLHSCVSGPWKEEFTPILTLLTPGGTNDSKTFKAEVAATAVKETNDGSESIVSAPTLNYIDIDNSQNINEEEINEHLEEKKKTNDLIMDWESDDEGDLEEKAPKEPENKAALSKSVEKCKNDFLNTVSVGSLESLGCAELATTADSDVPKTAKPNVVVLKNIKTDNKKRDGIERPYKCTKCAKTFSLKNSLKRHIDNTHNKSKIIEATTKSLIEKYGINSDDIENPHKCKVCEESFNHKSKLKGHMRRVHKIVNKIVTKQSPFSFQYDSYVCPHCQRDLNEEFPEMDPKSMIRKQNAYRRHLKFCLVDQFTCSCSNYSSPTTHQANHVHSRVIMLKTKYQHMVEEHGEPVYWCQLPRAMAPPTERLGLPTCTLGECLLTFPSLEGLRGHREKVAQGKVTGRKVTRSFFCSDCGKDFTYMKTFRRYKDFRLHKSYCKVEQFSCDCPGVPSVAPGEAPSKPRERKKKLHHMQIVHMGQFGCLESSECYKTFETKELLEEHILEMHKKPSEKPNESFSCEECGQQFNKYTSGKFSEDFEKHKRSHKIVNFSCDCPNIPRIVMESVFTYNMGNLSKPALIKERHIHEHHLGWFGCKKCIKSFETAEDCQKHELCHIKSFMCATCGSEKASQSNLDKHINEHHEPQSIECEICKKLCPSKEKLRTHVKHNHSPLSECDICGKSIRNLDIHMRVVHTAEKPYKCLNCDKSFVYEHRREAHNENMHIKSQPYACRYGCEKRYNDESNRRQHEKRRHREYFKT